MSSLSSLIVEEYTSYLSWRRPAAFSLSGCYTSGASLLVDNESHGCLSQRKLYQAWIRLWNVCCLGYLANKPVSG